MKTLDEIIHNYVDELSFLWVLKTTHGNTRLHVRNQQKTVDTAKTTVETSVESLLPEYRAQFMDMLHYFAYRIFLDDNERDSMLHFRLTEFMSYMFAHTLRT